MEVKTESNRDSISLEANSKGINWSAKCYIGGNGDPDDTELKACQRLLRYKSFLSTGQIPDSIV